MRNKKKKLLSMVSTIDLLPKLMFHTKNFIRWLINSLQVI